MNDGAQVPCGEPSSEAQRPRCGRWTPMPTPTFAATSLALVLAFIGACGHDEPINGIRVNDGSRSNDAGVGNAVVPKLTSVVGGGASASDAASDALSSDTQSDMADGGSDAANDALDGRDGGHAVFDARPDGPPVCGDGWRDLETEECDDGLGSEADWCDNTCRVRDVLVGPNIASDGPLAPPGRVLGQGRHPVAAGASGFAVAFIEREPEPAVKLRAFGGLGAPLTSAITLSSGTAVIDASAPVIAALPSGAYAAAWTDLNGDGDLRGIAFAIADPAQPVNVPSFTFVNEQRQFSQQAPDLVVTDSEIVVAWVDDADSATAPDLRYRRLSHSGTPLSSGDEVLAATNEGEANLALARFGSSWAAAWRSGHPAGETIQVKAGNVSWSVGPFFQGGAAEDRPALVEIDSTHLFLVFVERAWGDSGAQPVPRLRWAVLDTALPGPVEALALEPRVAPWALDSTLAQEQPAAARAGDAVYVAWHSARVIGDARAQESWLKRIDLQTAAGGVTLDFSAPEIDLPRESAHSANDQRFPALAAGSVPGSAALVAVWDDYGRSFGPGQGAPDVVAELIPVPSLRLSARRLGR